MTRVTSGGTLTGFGELEARLLALSVEMATKMGARAVRKGANVIKQSFKEAAPVGPTPQGDHGHAKISSSLRVKKGNSADSNSITYLPYISGKAFHALFLERGTIHMAPHPFAVGAFDASSARALEAIAADLTAQLDKAGL